jgi:uncharacterized protein
MDPLLIFFGFGVGVLVGMTGMGGGSLMTPLLVLLFGVKPTLAVGTDIAYQAITKSVGAVKHWRLKTINFGASLWLASGSMPGAVLGVQVIQALKRVYGDQVETFTLTALGGVLAFVGIFTLARSLLWDSHITSDGVEHVSLSGWQKAAAITIGVTTGFVIGITSAGSGTVIAVALIALFKIPPRYVVGTDVFHGALLLWAAGLAHWASNNIDFGLMGTLLLGSIPGVYIGAHFSIKVPESALRTALGAVLVASASATLNKAGVHYVPALLIGVALTFVGTILLAIRAGKMANPWTLSAAAEQADLLPVEPTLAPGSPLPQTSSATQPAHARPDAALTRA